MVQFLANILVYLFGSTYKYFLNVFKKRSAVEADKFKPGMWFVLGDKPYMVETTNPQHDLVDKFNRLLAAGVFQKNLCGGIGTWGYRVNAVDRTLFFFQYPLVGDTNNVIIQGDAQGVLVIMGDGFDKVNCMELISEALDYLLSILIAPSGERRDPNPVAKRPKSIVIKPVQTAPEPTIVLKGRKSYKNRTAFVAKRQEPYRDPK